MRNGARCFDEFAHSLLTEKASHHQKHRFAGRQSESRVPVEVDTGTRNPDNAGKVTDHASGANVILVRLVVDEHAAVPLQGDAVHPSDDLPEKREALVVGALIEEVAEPGDKGVTLPDLGQPRRDKPVDYGLHGVAEHDVGLAAATGSPERGQRTQIGEGIEPGTGHRDLDKRNADRGQGIDCRRMMFGPKGDDVVSVMHHRLEQSVPEVDQRKGVAADDRNLAPVLCATPRMCIGFSIHQFAPPARWTAAGRACGAACWDLLYITFRPSFTCRRASHAARVS